MSEGHAGGARSPGRQALWYVRRRDREVGPHPRRVIVDGLLLGRFDWSDLASLDRVEWLPLRAFEAQLAADERVPEEGDWRGERVAAARRWADERSGRDRRTGQAVPVDGSERRAAGDRRRSDEPLQVSIWRRLRLGRDRVGAAVRDRRELALASTIGLAIAVATLWFAPAPAPIPLARLPEARCESPAAPAADWRGCVRRGARLEDSDLRRARLAGTDLAEARLERARLDYADLAGADLSGARLTRARLFGAVLVDASLRDADLAEADLSYADLRGATIAGARFEGVRLDHAWWIDGRRCAAGSRSRCD